MALNQFDIFNQNRFSDLQSQGFKARCLAGGIQAWLAAEGPLEGNPAARTILQTRALAATGEGEARLVLRPLMSLGDALKKFNI